MSTSAEGSVIDHPTKEKPGSCLPGFAFEIPIARDQKERFTRITPATAFLSWRPVATEVALV